MERRASKGSRGPKWFRIVAWLLATAGYTVLLVAGVWLYFGDVDWVSILVAGTLVAGGIACARHLDWVGDRIGLIILILVLDFGFEALRPELWSRSFSPNAWKSAGGLGNIRRRKRMLPDLRGILAKDTIKSRKAALEYLGRPDRTWGPNDKWYYTVAPREPMGLMEPYLWLSFDESGRLVDYGVQWCD